MTEPRSPKRRPLLRLGLGLCALAALALMFGCSPEKAAPEPGDPPRMEEPLPAVSPDTLPEKEPEEALSPDGLPLVIPLRANEEAPTALEEGDPAAALASGDAVFSDRLDSGVELEIRRANPVPDPTGRPGIFYDVYALTRTPDTEWRVLGRLADDNIYVFYGDRLDAAERVPDILGQEGWQISLNIGAAAVVSWYFAATPQGAEFLFDVGSSQEAQVADLDGDGQGEAWEYYNHGEAGWSFYDRDAEGRLWRYFLPAGPGAPLDEAESEKGLVPAGMEGNALLEEDGNPLGPYLLKDGALHLQEEREP